MRTVLTESEQAVFHGSYTKANDCTFLLKRVTMPSTDVDEKERLIQSGAKHYSEMISSEDAPSQEYMRLFFEAMERNQERFAQDIARLAMTLAARSGGQREVVLVSLARAGTPVGVLVHRVLTDLEIESTHYSISIIRDRGIDSTALDYILQRHSDRDLVFLDGWTGKGAIATELASSVSQYNALHGTAVSTELGTVADLAGVAGLASTADDYLIPSSVLNSIISGLTSRSVLNAELVEPGDFHACIYYDHLKEHDLSNWFVDRIAPLAIAAASQVEQAVWPREHRQTLQATSEQFVQTMMTWYAVSDRNRVKPGIGESTRALLRRMPERLLVRDLDHEDVRHLVNLARTKHVPIELHPDMPYNATVIIKTLGEN